MSNDQQPNEQKAPTIWHVLGVVALIGGLIPLVLFNIFWGIGRVDPLVTISTIIPSIIGAAFGVLAPKTISKKWKGLWIGTVLGLVIGFGIMVTLVAIAFSSW